MSVSAVSNASSVYQPQEVKSQPPKPPQPAADTVQLSQAATAQAKGGDIDREGDNH